MIELTVFLWVIFFAVLVGVVLLVHREWQRDDA